MFQSHINYGLILWGAAAKKYMNRIWTLQKKAIRIVALETYNAHSNPLFHKLRILKLSDIYHLQLAQFMHKMYHKELPEPLNDKFISHSQIHDYNTRNRTHPRLPKIKTVVASKSIYYQSTSLWYKIDSNLRLIPNYSLFSRKLKQHLFLQYLTNQ